MAQTALAQPLTLYKTYSVTGDYVVGGVGLQGLGAGTGCGTGGTVACAAGNITIPDSANYPGNLPVNQYGPKPAGFVPDGADIVAAQLYWMTVEKAQSAFDGQKGFFRDYAISGKVLGNRNAPTSWSAGGCGGNNLGATTLRTYRADVRPFLPVVNGKHLGNGTFPVRLADSGGHGAPFTLGATLVIIYRVLLPPGNTDSSLSSVDAKLRIISLFDGSFSPSNSSETMSQTIQGFYQAASTPKSKLTHIVGNGQSNKYETLFFNNNAIAGSASSAAFPGHLNGSWDNPTFDVSGLVGTGDTATTSVTPSSSSGGCVSWGAVIFGTTVPNSGAGAVSDGPLSDGLVDAWKTPKTPPQGGAAVPGFVDAKDGSFVPLPGAVGPSSGAAGQRDLFLQVDYMCSIVTGGACDPTGHVHLPKQAALDMVGDAFWAQGIHVHFDVGNNYQTSAPVGLQTLSVASTSPPDRYIVPAAYASGGNIIDERAASVTCVDLGSKLCQFPGEATTSWKGGFTFLKNQPLNYPDENACETRTPPGGAPGSGPPCIRRFQSSRRHSHHEVIFGHALGRAPTNWRVGGVNPMLSSIVDSGSTATITTSSPHGFSFPGNVRLTISGAMEDFDLNGTYNAQITSATTLTVSTSNVTDRTYNVTRNPGLTVSIGPATSNMGWSDIGGADTLITFGKWHWDDVPGCQQNPAVPLAGGQAYCNDQVGTVQGQASALIHEVGHTLGLTHGGAYLTPTTSATPGISISYGPNCKFNFLSSMNYAFQFHGSGLPGYDGLGHVDYSRQVLPDSNGLNEGSLSESSGIGNPASFLSSEPGINSYRTRWFGPINNFLDSQLNTVVGGRAATVHCNGTPTEDRTMILLEGPLAPGAIDLNNDGDTSDTNLSQDTNFNGAPDSAPLQGFDDWHNGIDLRQIGARRGVLGLSADVWGGDADSFGGDTDSFGGDADSFGGDADSFGGDTDSFGGDADSFGGDADSFGGSVSQDYVTANASVDPPLQLTCTNCTQSSSPGILLENGKSVPLSSTLPGFGRIRILYVWRADITKAPMSSSNPPVLLKNLTVGSKTATKPPSTSVTDSTVSNGNTYLYFETVALGDDSGVNSGNQSGPSNFLRVTVSFSNKNNTTTALASGKNPSSFGDSVTFTATVSPSTATGIVTFKDGTVTLGTGTLSSGIATSQISNLSVGTHSITAIYAGDTNNGGSTSNTISQVVNKLDTTNKLTFNQPAPGGGSVTLIATLTPLSPAVPTGTVTFKDGSSTIGTAPVNSSGVATLLVTLSVGTHPSITAAYGGDTNYNGSTSNAVSVTVTAASDFSISVSPGSQRVKAGTTAQYTVTITPSAGFSETVSFAMASAPVGPTATFNPVTLPGTGSTTMTVTVPDKGTFTLTITGTSSSFPNGHSTTVTVIGN